MTRNLTSPVRTVLAGLASGSFVFAAMTAQAADAKNGAQLFMENCAVCHTAAKGEPNKIGPNLFGVVGRKSAIAPGYMYSPAMMKAGLTWDQPTLTVYLQGPQKKVPGTKMGFPGFSDPSEEADVIAYLVSLK